MLDLADDKIIVDDPDEWKDEPKVERRRRPTTLQSISLGRVPTEELAMYVRLYDGLHRCDPNEAQTACSDELYDSREIIERRTERQGPEHPLALCPCWTPKEWVKADRLYRQKWGRDYDGPRPKP